MVPLEWHKEAWIKHAKREDFIEWCRLFQPEYTSEEAAMIYDSHVMPKESEPEIDPDNIHINIEED